MAPNDSPEFNLVDLPAPQIQLHRLKNIITYEVMASDLDRLEDAAGEEKNAAVFCTTAIGGAIGGILGILAWSSGDISPVRIGVYVAITLVLVIASMWFGAIWSRKAKLHKRISTEIRQNAVMPARDKHVAQGTPTRTPLTS